MYSACGRVWLRYGGKPEAEGLRLALELADLLLSDTAGAFEPLGPNDQSLLQARSMAAYRKAGFSISLFQPMERADGVSLSISLGFERDPRFLGLRLQFLPTTSRMEERIWPMATRTLPAMLDRLAPSYAFLNSLAKSGPYVPTVDDLSDSAFPTVLTPVTYVDEQSMEQASLQSLAETGCFRVIKLTKGIWIEVVSDPSEPPPVNLLPALKMLFPGRSFNYLHVDS